MPRLPAFLLLLSFIVLCSCSTSVDIDFYVIAHDFQNPIAEKKFLNGITNTADSLNISTALLNAHTEYPKKHLDSLFKYTSGIAVAAPIGNRIFSTYINKAVNTGIPVVQLNQAEADVPSRIFINTDAYTAGLEAARFILEQYGDNGRFGILTPTLDNSESTESIRGFRQLLSPAKWKQVNIITCDDGDEALKQYRHATRFGNRIIWFVANDCSDLLPELKNIKKDNFFIAIDLHAKKNSIKFLQDGLLDAVVTTDFARMGQLALCELTSALNNVNDENTRINCGSLVLTSASIDRAVE